MAPAVVLFIQAIAGPPAPADATRAGGRLELVKPCPADGTEIVVCGRRSEDEEYRVRPLDPDRFEPKPLRATIGVGNGTLGIGGDQQAFGNGAVGNRVMLKFRMKF